MPERKPKLTPNQWWRATEQGQDPHTILDRLVREIEDDQSGRYQAYREYERIFGSNHGPMGDDSYATAISDQITQNECQNVIETLHAQIFKNKIVPAVSVSESDWEEWDRAKKLSRWLEGVFDESRVYIDVFPKAGIHKFIYGTGVIRVGWEEVDSKTARIFSWAVNPKYCYVDRFAAKHGKPREFFFKDHIDRFKLFDTYGVKNKGFYGTPKDRMDGIDDCTDTNDIDSGATNFTKTDIVTVREAYRLPSSPKAKDGRHVIWIKGCTLVDEPFTWDRFPFVVMRFGRPVEGFYGESAVKRLAPTQRYMDELNKKIQESQRVMGVPRIIVGNDITLSKQHIDDEIGSIIKADGNVQNSIKEWNAQCATPELYADRDSMPGKMRSLLGVSEFETQQQIPQGMRDVSGAFLERWVEQGQARHAIEHNEYEHAVPDLAILYLYQAEECQGKGYDVVVKAPADSHNKSSIEELSFRDCKVDLKRLKLKVQPMSQLPQTFSGKVDAFQKLKDAGYPIDQKTVLRLMEVPDLQGETDLLVSDEEIIMKNLSYMCRTGEYLAPMPFDNLDLIVQLTTRFINRYRVREGADTEKVALLAQYIDDAILLKKGLGAANPSAPPTMQALGLGAAPGGPMPGQAPGQVPPNQPPPLTQPASVPQVPIPNIQ
jgi:hypothetical protein